MHSRDTPHHQGQKSTQGKRTDKVFPENVLKKQAGKAILTSDKIWFQKKQSEELGKDTTYALKEKLTKSYCKPKHLHTTHKFRSTTVANNHMLTLIKR